MYLLSVLFILAQASPPRPLPIWVVIVASVGAACIGALASLAATWITLSRTNQSQRQEAWRVERKQAYTPFFALARRARQTLDWDTPQGSKAQLLEDLREA